jgi:hypothetical protein
MRDNLKVVKEMVKEYFGGVMEVVIKVISKMECNVGLEFCIVQIILLSIKALGTMECLMVKAFKHFKMEKDMKEASSKINFMEMVYSIKTIQSFMDLGKTMN